MQEWLVDGPVLNLWIVCRIEIQNGQYDETYFSIEHYGEISHFLFPFGKQVYGFQHKNHVTSDQVFRLTSSAVVLNSFVRSKHFPLFKTNIMGWIAQHFNIIHDWFECKHNCKLLIYLLLNYYYWITNKLYISVNVMQSEHFQMFKTIGYNGHVLSLQTTQFKRGGGQICFQNHQAWTSFRNIVATTEDCPKFSWHAAVVFSSFIAFLYINNEENSLNLNHVGMMPSKKIVTELQLPCSKSSFLEFVVIDK